MSPSPLFPQLIINPDTLYPPPLAPAPGLTPLSVAAQLGGHPPPVAPAPGLPLLSAQQGGHDVTSWPGHCHPSEIWSLGGLSEEQIADLDLLRFAGAARLITELEFGKC